jgi:hypothetical protein
MKTTAMYVPDGRKENKPASLPPGRRQGEKKREKGV